jgi:hypothetical protein
MGILKTGLPQLESRSRCTGTCQYAAFQMHRLLFGGGSLARQALMEPSLHNSHMSWLRPSVQQEVLATKWTSWPCIVGTITVGSSLDYFLTEALTNVLACNGYIQAALVR